MPEVVRTIRASGGDYTSLSAWEAAEARDLTATGEIAVAECYNDWPNGLNDHCVISSTAWVTSSTAYIHIRPAAGHKHAGKLYNSDGTYTGFAIYNNVNDGVISAKINYVWVDGLIIENPRTSQAYVGAFVTTAKLTRCTDCLLKAHHGQALRDDSGGQASYSDWRLAANVVAFAYGNANAIKIGGGFRLYNATALNNGTATVGINTANPSWGKYIANTVSYGFSTSYSGSSIFGTNNASSNATTAAPPGNNPLLIDVAASDFVDITSDGHITSSSSLRGAGADLSADTYYPFNWDIDGYLRRAPWDIGADQYVPVLSAPSASTFGTSSLGTTPLGISALSAPGPSPVAQSTDLQWAVLSTTLQQLIAQWQTLVSTSQQSAFQWNTLVSVLQQLIAQWNVLQSATVESPSSVYGTSALGTFVNGTESFASSHVVAQALDLQWTTIAAVMQQFVAQWQVLQTLSTSTQVDWQVLQQVQQALTSLWTALSQVVQGTVLDWQTLGVATQSTQLDWLSLSTLTTGLQTNWRVLLEVLRSTQLDWQTQQQIASALQIDWSVLSTAIAQQNVQLLWNTIGTASQSTTFDWRALNSVTQILQLAFQTLATTSVTTDVAWRVLTTTLNGLGIPWTTRTVTTGSSTQRWLVLNPAANSLDLLYKVLGAAAASGLSIDWQTIAPVRDQGLTLQWLAGDVQNSVGIVILIPDTTRLIEVKD